MKRDDEGVCEGGVTAALVSLGCAKNLVESEVMLADLGLAGFVVTGDYSQAEVIVVNTCGFLQLAQREAAETIDQLSNYKYPRGRCKCLVVAGCWSQIASEEILSRWNEVDLVIGVNDRRRLVRAIDKVLAGRARLAKVAGRVPRMWPEEVRFRLTPRHWAYLRISEGCSQKCSFCSIPRIRGRYRSKPPADVIREAKQLIDSGARELVLIGQETTNYGRDLGLKAGLARLLRKLNRLNGIDWIRVMYTYPANFEDSTISALADLEHVVKYVDIPLQHINDRILKLMKRRIDRAATERLLDKLRKRIPQIAIRTTMIVGFPTETDEEFAELVQFVKEFQFDALGAFVFSPEPGTRAADMTGQIDDRLKQQRLDTLMRTQRKIAYQSARNWIGKRFAVYIEPADRRRKYLVARHSQQAPEVDPVTLIARTHGAVSPRPGDKLQVKCVRTRGYDLVAEPTQGRR